MNVLNQIVSKMERDSTRNPNFDFYNFSLHLFRRIRFSEMVRCNLQRALQVLSDHTVP
jgi:hypothetical protein